MIERTGLEDIPTEECWSLIAGRTVGRLGVAIKNRPDIFPVNYRVIDGELLIKTAPGIKLAAATLGPAIAFEVDDVDEATHHGWSVVVHGTAHEVTDLEGVLAAEAEAPETWAESEKTRFIRIIVDEITGRRIPEDSPS